MLVVGNTIGVGIFTTSGIVAQTVPSSGWMLAAWLIGGVLALAGALAWAELSAMFPQAGGEYVYLHEAFGSFWGFLCGWAAFLANFSGSIAVLAIALAEYLIGALTASQPDPWTFTIGGGAFSVSFVQSVAILLVWAVSLLNYRGLRFGSVTQNVLGMSKLVAISGLLALGLTSDTGSWSHFSPVFRWEASTSLLSALGLALIPIMFAYSGWNAAAYIASEVRDPERTVPRALVAGTVITIGVYVALNTFYLYAVPVAGLRGEVQVGEVTARVLFGDNVARVVSAIIALSIAGVLNAMVLTGPRVYFAMARNGVFFARAARIHPRFDTPGDALLLQAGWTSLLILSGTFEQLLTYTTLVIVGGAMCTVSAVIFLRRTRPELTRPYRTWGYPWSPTLYILGSLGILLNALWERPTECLWGFGLCVAGAPAYWWWRGRTKPWPSRVKRTTTRGESV